MATVGRDAAPQYQPHHSFPRIRDANQDEPVQLLSHDLRGTRPDTCSRHDVSAGRRRSAAVSSDGEAI
jgi:hypothetical protein